MRIAQVVHGYPPEFVGGTEWHVQELSRSLVTRGHPCLVVAGSAWPCPEPSVALGSDGDVDVARVIGLSRRKGLRPASYDPAAEGVIKRLLERWRPQIVHLHHWSRLTDNLVAICRGLDVPAVVTLHDQWIACSRYHRLRPDGGFCADATPPCASCVDRDPWQSTGEVERELTLRGRAIRQELQLADRLLVPSRAQQMFLHSIVGLPLDRLEIVPLGSPRKLERPEGHARSPSHGGPIKIGHWGYLLPEKGVHVLLEAARRLSSEAVLEWHIYGTAPDQRYQARLTQLAEGLPVMFHGAYDRDTLQSMDLDVAVFPSICCETYSFVLDEAFQLGIPVVVPNRGAFPERVGDAGRVFECGDAGDLAAQLEAIVKEPEALRRLGQGATHERVVLMDDHVGRLEKIYQEVVDSYLPGPAPERDDRDRVLHMHRQVIDRDHELGRLQGAVAEMERTVADLRAEMERTVADVRAETDAEARRLLQTIETLREEREWWRKQARELGDDLRRIERTFLFRLYGLFKNPPG